MPEPEITVADRRLASLTDRLATGMFSLYHRATGAKKSDRFVRDMNSWGPFQQAVLPELLSFSFFDRKQKMPRTPSSVLSDSMYQVWATERRGTTIQVINELATHICAHYEITALDRRARKRASLGLDIVA